MSDSYKLQKQRQYKLLCSIYHTVFGESFVRKNPIHRMQLQKAVFFMHEMGFPCGDYGFRWDEKGPYSNQLSNDVWAIGNTCPDNNDLDPDANAANAIEEEIISSEMAQAAALKIKDVFINSETNYKLEEWVEVLGSVLYMKRYMYPAYDASQIAETLPSLGDKKALNNESENKKAVEKATSLIA